MFRVRDSVGLPADLRLNRKSSQCEHFLKCFSVIVDAAQENAVDLQAIRLDLVGNIACVVSPSPTASQLKELAQDAEGDRTVSSRTQNERSTVNAIYLFSHEQRSVNTYWATFHTLIFPKYPDTDSLQRME